MVHKPQAYTPNSLLGVAAPVVTSAQMLGWWGSPAHRRRARCGYARHVLATKDCLGRSKGPLEGNISGEGRLHLLHGSRAIAVEAKRPQQWFLQGEQRPKLQPSRGKRSWQTLMPGWQLIEAAYTTHETSIQCLYVNTTV